MSNFQAFTNSRNPRTHRSTDLPIHESTNHDSTNPRIYDPRIHKHHNPRIHESTSPFIHKSTNPRVNHTIWVCLPLHTVCCQPHFAHCTRKDGNETYGTVHCFASVPELQKLALCCFASVKCFVIWFTFS